MHITSKCAPGPHNVPDGRSKMRVSPADFGGDDDTVFLD